MRMSHHTVRQKYFPFREREFNDSLLYTEVTTNSYFLTERDIFRHYKNIVVSKVTIISNANINQSRGSF